MPIILVHAEPPAAVALAPGETTEISTDAAAPPQPASGRPNYYPERAWRDRIEGSAVIHCKVTATGQLADCTVVREEPEGSGFGEAAIKLSALFKMKWMGRSATPVEGEANVPIKFRLPKH